MDYLSGIINDFCDRRVIKYWFTCHESVHYNVNYFYHISDKFGQFTLALFNMFELLSSVSLWFFFRVFNIFDAKSLLVKVCFIIFFLLKVSYFYRCRNILSCTVW